MRSFVRRSRLMRSVSSVCSVLLLFVLATAAQAQQNADFSAMEGSWASADGPPGWILVLGNDEDRGLVVDFPRSQAGGRAFRFQRPSPNFGTSRLEQCLPVGDRIELRMRVSALTDTPDAGLALRLRMDFFQDADCTIDAKQAATARIETDHVLGPGQVDVGAWHTLLSAGRLRAALADDSRHVRISVRQRDRSNDAGAADPALPVWLDRVELVDAAVRIDAAERAALLALHAQTAGDDWRHDDGWDGPEGSECDWYGVRCSADRQHVVALDLAFNGLHGVLPEAVAGLVHLRPGDGLRLCWNRLEATSAQIDAFVRTHHLGASWQDCQGVEPVALDPGALGVWSDAERPGERLLLSPLAQYSHAVDWLGFAEDGEPIWLAATGASRQRQLRLTELRLRPPGAGSSPPIIVGQAEWALLDCRHARLAFDLELEGQRHRGVRLLQREQLRHASEQCTPEPVDSVIAAYIGHWHDPERPHEAVSVQPLAPGHLAVHWLRNDQAASAQWLHGLLPVFEIIDDEIEVPLWRVSGGRFGERVDTSTLQQQSAGSAILRRGDDGHLALTTATDEPLRWLSRLRADPAVQASASYRLYVDMDPEDLAELYRRPANDDTVLPASAHLAADGPELALSGIRFRGNASRYLPKKSFNIRFQERQSALFGSARMNLNAGWPDPLMQREAIAMAMFRDLGRMAPRTRHFDLFLNGVYEGLYTHVERVDGDLLAAWGRNEGTLVRDQLRHAFAGDPKVNARSLFGFDLRSLPEDEREAFVAAHFDSRGSPDWSALVELALWLQDTYAGAAFAEGFAERFDVEAFIDWLAVHVLIGDIDSFGDDYWLHLDPDEAQPRWRMIPWDKDLSFGAHYRHDHGVDNDYFHYEYPIASNFDNRLIERFIATTSLRRRLHERVLELAESVFTSDHFRVEVDARTDTLLDSIEIVRGPGAFVRHPGNHHGLIGRHALHRQTLLEFVELRRRFLQRRIDGGTGEPGSAELEQATLAPSQPLWFTDRTGWSIGRLETEATEQLLDASLSVSALPEALGLDRRWHLEISQAIGPGRMVLFYRNEIAEQFGARNWVTAGDEPVGSQDQLRGYRLDGDCLQPLPTSVNPYANRVELALSLPAGGHSLVVLDDEDGWPGHPVCGSREVQASAGRPPVIGVGYNARPLSSKRR